MIQDLSELAKFLKLCRKQGVREITFGGTKVVLGDLPAKTAEEDDSDPAAAGMSDEDMAFFSAGGPS